MITSEYTLNSFTQRTDKRHRIENFVAQRHLSYYFHFLLAFCFVFLQITADAVAQPEVSMSIRAGSSGYLGVGVGGFVVEADSSGIVPDESLLLQSVKNTITGDLNESGFFEVKTLDDSLRTLSGGLFAQWRATGAQCYLFGEKGNGNTVDITLVDLKTTVTIFYEEYRIDSNRPWYTAHVIVDDMIELFTGVRGSMASHLAFFYPHGGESNELYLIESDGRERRQLTFTKTLNVSPSWSADGTNIAFSSLINNDWLLMMINLNTGQTQDITRWSGLNTSPSWHPSKNDVLALSSNRDGNSEIYTCQKDGTNLRRLTNHYRIDSSPTWSPDGSQLAFTSDRAGMPVVYVMNSDGTNQHRLTSMMNAYEGSPCWSPRGDRIAFVVMFDRSFDIATASPSGDDMIILTSGQGSNENPRWSPDGLRIVFSSTRLGGKNIFIMDWDGSNVRPLTTDSKSFSPAWAPSSSGNDIRISSRR